MAIRYLSGINVDSNTLFVDDANNRVGIGTASPNSALEISQLTPIVRINSSDNTQFHGIEFRNGGSLDAFIKQLPETGEFRISNGRGASWGGHITLYTDTVERLRITSAGNVGIGTTAPATALDVNGTISVGGSPIASFSGNYNRILRPNGTVGIYLGNATDAGNYYDNTTHYFRSSAGSSTYAVINNLGNVGIGTTSPSTNLHVAGSVRVSGNNTNRLDLDGGVRITGQYYGNGNTEYTYIDMYNNANASINIGTKHPLSYISFESGNGAYTERMRITNAGNVGIGTTSPNYKLDVNGSINIYTGNSLRWGSGDVEILNSGYSMLFSTYTGSALTEKMRITSAGNVGIGATALEAKLHVVYGAGEAGILSRGASGDTWFPYTNGQNYVRGVTNFDLGSVYFTGGNIGIGTTSTFGRLQISGAVGNPDLSSATATGVSLVISNNDTGYGTMFATYGNGNGALQQRRTNTNTYYDFLLQPHGGNVGIGTTSPVVKLQVDGTITSTGPLTAYTSVPSINIGHNGDSAFIAATSGGGADTPISFSVGNNNEKMRITAAGNVGIGTTSPSYKLDVNGNVRLKDAASELIINNATYSELNYGPFNYFRANGGQAVINGPSIAFLTGGTEKVRIDAAGNVGIGTTSPAAKLHTVGEGIVDIVQSSNTVSYTQYYTSSTGASSTSDGLTVGLNGLDGYVFLREAANLILGTSDTERLRITAAGNVGIGTTSPQDKLTVKGATNYNLNLGLLGGYSGIYVYNDASSAYNHLRIDASPLLLNSYSGGNVGIGTASPAEKLHVSGKILQNNGGSLYLDANATNTILASVGARAVVFEVDSANRLVIGSTGTIRLNNYGSGSKTGTVAYNLAVDSSGNIIETAGGVVDGSGTANYVSKWSDANTLTDSVIYDNGTNVGIGTTPNQGVRLQVAGAVDAWNSLNTLLRLSHDGTRGKIQSYTGGGYSPTALNADGGNVLIGTTTDAGYKLDVNGTAIVRGNMSTDGELGITLAWSGSTINDQRIGRIRPISTPSQNPYAGGLAFDYYKYDGSAYNFFEGIRLNGSGNVGIGTISPNARLTVVANDSSNPNVALRLSSTGYSGVPYPYTSIRFGSAYSSYPSWNLASIDAGYTGASWGGSLLFYTNNDSGETNLTERMRITSDGNVAINSTTTSGYRLYVNGSTWINGGTNFQDGVSIFRTESGAAEVMRIASNGNVGIGTTSPATKLHTIGYVRTDGGMIVNGSDANYREIIFTTSSASRWNLYTYGAEGGANAGSVLYLARYADNGDYIANVATFLRTNGYVGIATTTPTQQLHVSGNVRVTGAYYDSSNSAGSSGQVLSSTGSGTDWVSLSEISGVDGTGTANYVAKWSDADTIANSSITDNGSTVTANVDRLNMNKQAGIYTFSKTVAATVASDFFSISNSHGAQAFRVTFVCSSSGYSVAKTYEVVHAYGLAPIYFKVVDTGPYGSEDFDVAFTNSNSDTGVKATVTNNSATLSGNIVATVFLGGGFETITITAL
jgi:hypothetical protein